MVNPKRFSWTLQAALLTTVIAQSGCGKFGAQELETALSEGPYVYVASGATYAGNGVTPSAASNTIAKYTLAGALVGMVYDFNRNPGDQPVQMVDYDTETLLVLVENAGGARRVDRLRKDGSSDPSNFISNSALSGGIVRALFSTADGGWLISRTTLIEKFNGARARVLAGATGTSSWVTAPAGSCTNSATLIPSVVEGPSDHILYAHAAAGQNRIGMISKSGYVGAANCLAAVAAPTVNHFPTTLLYHSSGKLFVAYGNATGAIHQIYSYDVSSSSFSNAVQVLNDPSAVAGITSMAEMPDGRILVSSALPGMNTVEAFVYNVATNSLTRSGNGFIPPSVYTRSIAGMIISN